MNRTKHYAEAALAATAGLQVDRDSLGFDLARMKHPSGAYVQVMDRMRWLISSMDPDALTAGFRVTRHFPLVGDAVPATRTTLIRAARVWRDNGRPWLATAPLIEMLDEAAQKREPYPITWAEQAKLLMRLPGASTGHGGVQREHRRKR